MKPSIAAALLSLGLAPLTTHAQAAEPRPAAVAPAAALAAAPPAAPVAEPVGPWSLGAGVGLSNLATQYYVLGGGLGGLVGIAQSSAPAVRASLERALAPGWWLELGVAGSASRSRGEAPDGSVAATRVDQTTTALNLGVRRALTRPGAPVLVSMDLAVVGGYAAAHFDWETVTPQTQRAETWRLGLAAGLAVERELTSGLSLRIGTPLLDAYWTGSSAETTTSGKATLKGGSASLVLSPWLELRQAF